MRTGKANFILLLALATLMGPFAHAQGGAAAPTSEAKKAPKAKTQPTGTSLDPVTRRVRQMADELRSPFCPGKTLMTCTSYQAFELRREIETMVRSGLTDPEILKKLKAIHGEDISNPVQPWYTFFVPFLPFIFLAGLIFWVVRRWRRGDGDPLLGEADFEAASESSEHAVDEKRLARLRARVRDQQN